MLIVSLSVITTVEYKSTLCERNIQSVGSHKFLRENGLKVLLIYCKFGNFRENFIFANSIKRRICDNLPTSVNHRVISPFHKGFIFT